MKFDKSIIKGKDLGILNQVMEYLGNFGLKADIGGSAKTNPQEGRPRNYRDIDIVVKYNNDDNRRDAIRGLNSGFYSGIFKSEYTPKFESNIVDHNQKGQKYMGLDIQNRFTIRDSKTNTTIDLCFEGYHVENIIEVMYFGKKEQSQEEKDQNHQNVQDVLYLCGLKTPKVISEMLKSSKNDCKVDFDKDINKKINFPTNSYKALTDSGTIFNRWLNKIKEYKK